MNEATLERNVVIRLASSIQKKTIDEAMAFYTGILHGEFERIWSLVAGAYPECNRKLARLRNGWVLIQQVTEILKRVYFRDDRISFLNPGESVVKVHNFKEDVKIIRGLKIECTVKEALIIRDCLNLYSRVLMGQIREVDWVMRNHHWSKIKNHDPRTVSLLMELMSSDLFGFRANESFGIASRDNSDKSKVGYELLRWIEYDLFKDDPDIKSGYSVMKEEPLRVTGQKRISLKFV